MFLFFFLGKRNELVHRRHHRFHAVFGAFLLEDLPDLRILRPDNRSRWDTPGRRRGKTASAPGFRTPPTFRNRAGARAGIEVLVIPVQGRNKHRVSGPHSTRTTLSPCPSLEGRGADLRRPDQTVAVPSEIHDVRARSVAVSELINRGLELLHVRIEVVERHREVPVDGSRAAGLPPRRLQHTVAGGIQLDGVDVRHQVRHGHRVAQAVVPVDGFISAGSGWKKSRAAVKAVHEVVVVVEDEVQVAVEIDRHGSPSDAVHAAPVPCRC